MSYSTIKRVRDRQTDYREVFIGKGIVSFYHCSHHNRLSSKMTPRSSMGFWDVKLWDHPINTSCRELSRYEKNATQLDWIVENFPHMFPPLALGEHLAGLISESGMWASTGNRILNVDEGQLIQPSSASCNNYYFLRHHLISPAYDRLVVRTKQDKLTFGIVWNRCSAEARDFVSWGCSCHFYFNLDSSNIAQRLGQLFLHNFFLFHPL